jgi:predicted metal-dependent phosphoesterase TrpH
VSGIDLHTHTTASDAPTPAELVREAVRRGASLAVTDHDSVDAVVPAS